MCQLLEDTSLQILLLMCYSCESPYCNAMWHCEDKTEWYLYHFTRHFPYRAMTLHRSLHTSFDCFHLSLLFHRSAFTMHVEAGHSAVPEEGPKDLRCPLCLYHTKYKRNMIDHIVLHRGNDIPLCVCLMREMLNNIRVFQTGVIKFSPLRAWAQVCWIGH